MSDILTSISTVITVIAILYSLWYQDIEKAIKEKLPEHKDDQEEPKKRVKSNIDQQSNSIIYCEFFILHYIYSGIDRNY